MSEKLRRLVLISHILLLVCASLGIGFAQHSEENLYFKALQAYQASAIEQYATINTRRNYRDLIILRNNEITADLPVYIGEYRVTFKSSEELYQQFRKKRERIPITEIRPIRNEENKLIVSFTERWLSYRNANQIFFSLEGGCNVELIFDCSQQKFVVTKVEFWGI